MNRPENGTAPFLDGWGVSRMLRPILELAVRMTGALRGQPTRRNKDEL